MRCGLEIQLERHPELAGIVSLRTDHIERRIAERCAGRPKTHVIRDMESFRSDLQIELTFVSEGGRRASGENGSSKQAFLDAASACGDSHGETLACAALPFVSFL
jgi:hypothetical protein